MKFTRVAVFSLVTALAGGIPTADAQLLIGGADSGAINENGDLQIFAPFTIPNVGVNFGGGSIIPGGQGTFGFEVLDEDGLSQDPPVFANTGGTVDEDFLTGEGLTLASVTQINVLNGLDFASVSIPGFTLAREGDISGGSDAFGIDDGTGSPIDALDIDNGEGGLLPNFSAFANNGVLSLTSDNIDVGAAVGAGSTFDLTYLAAVDGAGGNDTINFTATLTVTDGNGLSVDIAGSTPLFTDQTTAGTGAFSIVDGETVQGVGVDLLAEITQTFTVPNDINAQLVTLSIEFGEVAGQETGGVDRGVVDNIELSAVLEEVTTLFGDFNADGVVDAADFAAFRDNIEGDDAAINNAGVTDGVVDGADFDLFEANFSVAAEVGTLASASAVPEPSSILALLTGVALVPFKRRR